MDILVKEINLVDNILLAVNSNTITLTPKRGLSFRKKDETNIKYNDIDATQMSFSEPTKEDLTNKVAGTILFTIGGEQQILKAALSKIENATVETERARMVYSYIKEKSQ